MLRSTKQLWESMKSAEWFGEVGSPPGPEVARIKSWPDAVKSCTSVAWIDTWTEAANILRLRVHALAPERMEVWRAISKELESIVLPIVRKKCVAVIGANELPPAFFERVRWDMTGILIEQEYADLVEPEFWKLLHEWYMKGHFPCGWSGKYPNGKIKVY